VRAASGIAARWAVGKLAEATIPAALPPMPMDSSPGQVTQLLAQWSEGDEAAFSALVTLVYDDLRAIAHRRLLASQHDTLATTALVNEVYLRLVGHAGGQWEGRAQFFGFASRAMRHILVDHARRARAEKRGGSAVQIALDDIRAPGNDAAGDVLGVDEAIDRLAQRNVRMAQIVELRFFGGFNVVETAEVLGTSVRTVEREWTRAKAYLLEELDTGVRRTEKADGAG
jgi:RNA polymerase sigma factor (TIGR02999 family)